MKNCNTSPDRRHPMVAGTLVLAMAAAAAALWPNAACAETAPPAVAFNLEAATAACMSCHGTDGHAQGVGYLIGGRPAAALTKALMDFKHDRRSGSVMPGIARAFASEELEALAREFSKYK